jgi:hypothetical protein
MPWMLSISEFSLSAEWERENKDIEIIGWQLPQWRDEKLLNIKTYLLQSQYSMNSRQIIPALPPFEAAVTMTTLHHPCSSCWAICILRMDSKMGHEGEIWFDTCK